MWAFGAPKVASAAAALLEVVKQLHLEKSFPEDMSFLCVFFFFFLRAFKR